MRFPGWQMKVYPDNLSWPWETAQCFSSLVFKNSIIFCQSKRGDGLSIYTKAVKITLKVLASVVGKIHSTGQKITLLFSLSGYPVAAGRSTASIIPSSAFFCPTQSVPSFLSIFKGYHFSVLLYRTLPIMS